MGRLSRLMTLSVGLTCASLVTGPLAATEIKGKVTQVHDKVVRIATDSELFPIPGDKVEITFQIPGLDEPVQVGTGQVTEIGADFIAATITSAKGKLVKNQLARITSDHPRKRGEAGPSPSVSGARSLPAAGKPGDGSWTSGVDAAVNVGNGHVVFFRGNQYLRFDIFPNRVAEGYPKLLDGHSWPKWPASWHSGVDAGVNWGNGFVYFFKGNEFLRFDLPSHQVVDVIPLSLDNKHWPSWHTAWNSGVDAAVNWGNGQIYFFKHNEYLRYDMRIRKMADGFPKPLNDKTWPKWPENWNSGVDAGVNWGNGYAYFFKGNQFLQFDVEANRVSDGYPKPLDDKHLPHWPMSTKPSP